ncbi:HNH endonuclease [Methylotuvimicrobium buryatense]|uniref:HNH endonuclease n=1 Tax=Methylotuvimicrobium buryatense TaxID=95641 RepID=A0A4P9UV06_METBY|nr:HNH endonuclease [Methylotuvimicrobium buryatense]QCW84580.1 HNH endonuclease [Methylotuvimicrobium buryatense]
MQEKVQNKLINRAIDVFSAEFGTPSRTTAKVLAWDIRHDLGSVMQIDGPNSEQGVYIWLPYPTEGQAVPEIALEYPGEAGRHSNTYASPGLSRGLPVIKLFVRTETQLRETIDFIKAFRDSLPLSDINEEELSDQIAMPVDGSALPTPKEIKNRREAIPRAVQREVWQRDGGRCVECGTKEKLCFDHIIPFSRGGSNTIRNLQLLCERCNLSKGNRI